MASLPTGTVTFLFADIEGSTRLLQQLGDRYADVLADYRRFLRTAIREMAGEELDTQGDSLFAAFPRARDALTVAISVQHSLLHHPWPDGVSLRARIGLHTGEALAADSGYIGMDVHRAARICAAGHGGQILLSDTTYALVAKGLPEGVSLRDLGEHLLKDLAHPHRLFQVMAAGLPAKFPLLKSLNVLPNNLPTQLSSFIGREREIGEVKTMLASTRLLTLTGTGGSGKTRLALQTGAELLDQYPDGVWLVEFGALVDPTLVPQTVAAALLVREQPEQPLTETLINSLHPKSLLLILDNCEHLLPACAGLADALLRGCPKTRILATSREHLGIVGETLFAVPPLRVPSLEQLPSLADLVQYESVRLFNERATAILATFRITPQDAKSIVQLCHDLDGIPLAIELAAARVKVLTVSQILARLGDRFRLLAGSRRTGPSRQLTLQAAMDWSYNLLAEKERAVLRRCTVFAGGCTLEAVETVCSGQGVETTEVLDLLTQLVDKSLLLADAQRDGGRYRMLETIRHYGRQKLVDSAEGVEARRKHFEWYCGFVERVQVRLSGGSDDVSDEVDYLDQLEREHDNLRAALEWCIANGEAEKALRLATSLSEFWVIRGHLSEGREWLLRALQRSEEGVPAALHAKALHWMGHFAQSQAGLSVARRYYDDSLKIYQHLNDKEGIALLLRRIGSMLAHQGDISARTFLEESLTIYRELGQKPGMASALGSLGSLERFQGNYDAARDLSEQSLVLRRESGDAEGTAWALRNLARVSIRRADFEMALRHLEEGLEIFRKLSEQAGVAWTLINMGDIACLRGDGEAARAYFEDSLAIFDKLGEKQGIGWALYGLGDVAFLQCAYATAETLYAKGLLVFRELAVMPGVFAGLAGFARLASRHEHPTRAARLHGAAEALREIMAYKMPTDSWQSGSVTDARRNLAREGLSAAWAEGRAMTLEQAIEYALADQTG
jgi:predicted ATPase/class 3 adenylate cyclase